MAVAVATATLTGLAGLPPAAPALASAVPAYDHVFWVVESGQPASSVIGPATYLTSLADANALATAYTAVDSSPLANRFALTAGQTYGVGDCLPAGCPQSGDSLATRIEAAGRTWGAYAESMPSACDTSPATDFAPQRVPFLYDTALAAECANRVVPYGQLAADLASDATTPDFVWISPNVQHDMSSSVGQGDSWLLANLPTLFASPAWRTRHSLLVVVVDQPGSTAGVATPVPAVLVASDGSVRSGYRSANASDHFGLLATVEASWGLAALTANDAGASPMSDMFNAQPSSAPTPTPSPTSSSAPTPTPTPQPGASPAPTLGPSPTATPGGTPEPAPGPSTSPTPGATPTTTSPGAGAPLTAAPTPGSNEFTIASPVIDVSDLTYVGPTTIASGSLASLPVLEFTATSLAMSSGSASVPSFSMESPCITQNGMSIAQLSTVPGTATATFGGGTTLYVTSIDFTYLGTAYSFTAATPPASFGPVTTGQLTAVSMVAARFAAGSTSLGAAQTVAFFQC